MRNPFTMTNFDQTLVQWFPNFSGLRTTQKNLVIREAQNIQLYRDWRTTSANLADHQWSAEQTLGITALVLDNQFFFTDVLKKPELMLKKGLDRYVLYFEKLSDTELVFCDKI